MAVAVSFGPGQREAGFAELAPALAVDLSIVEPMLGSAADMSAADADGHAVHWLDGAGGYGDVIAVFGYCAGATLAATVAQTIQARSGLRPHLILLDPRVVDADLMYRNFAGAVESFGEIIGDDELARITGDAREAAASAGSGDLRPLARTLCDEYERVVKTASAELGLGDDLAAEMSQRFEAYLTYLALASSAASVQATVAWSEATVLASTGHEVPDGLTVDTVFDVERDLLLADTAVAHRVSSVLHGES